MQGKCPVGDETVDRHRKAMTELYPILNECLRNLRIGDGKVETDLGSNVCEQLLYGSECEGAEARELDLMPSFLGYPESPFSRRLATNLEYWILHK